MIENISAELNTLFSNYPQLKVCKEEILQSFRLMRECYRAGGLIMVCGNGGSASDAGHIVGELMKGFKSKRLPTNEQRQALQQAFPYDADYLASHLQRAIPAVSLTDQVALSSAFVNDLTADMVFAQQVFGYGRKGDVLIGLTTSGNSANVVNACKVAKAFGIHTIGMTGDKGGELYTLCDVTIRVPASETYRVQEYHLPVYHALCAMLEADLFE